MLNNPGIVIAQESKGLTEGWDFVSIVVKVKDRILEIRSWSVRRGNGCGIGARHSESAQRLCLKGLLTEG